MRLSGPIAGGRWALPGTCPASTSPGCCSRCRCWTEDSEIVLTTPLESAAYVDMTLEALAPVRHRSPSHGHRLARPRRAALPLPRRARRGGRLVRGGLLAGGQRPGRGHPRGGPVRDDTAQGDRAVTGLLGKPIIDAENVPDLVPALAVAAASLPQTTVITGAARLRLKESDRLATTAAMLRALGHGCEITDRRAGHRGRRARALRRGRAHRGRRERPPHRDGRRRGRGVRRPARAHHRGGGRRKILPGLLPGFHRAWEGSSMSNTLGNKLPRDRLRPEPFADDRRGDRGPARGRRAGHGLHRGVHGPPGPGSGDLSTPRREADAARSSPG